MAVSSTSVSSKQLLLENHQKFEEHVYNSTQPSTCYQNITSRGHWHSSERVASLQTRLVNCKSRNGSANTA
ncbi:hypothetical protein EUGRSUZ_K00567 [Eucalyptus grandis]|uniref:Uncharacterized protein n=2 Tax=Eucalyptus grandis TaxID=71139 RepID=A0ACC3IRR2_EUCGR|nr:hypothetical protein EUGRSUZ_K00567 [Eucalyptus grandis]